MPPRAAKPPKPKMDDIAWGADGDRLVWAFLTECEKDVNYKILFGKKETTENTSGDTKTTVFKRIGQVILPKLMAIDAATVVNRLKGQLERMTKAYKKHAAKLRQTGGGLEDENRGNSESAEEHMRYYIPGEGPNESTPQDALNLWEQIERDFKFFPRLHRIFASRPNVTPIVVTTALGPQGRKTVWYQPADDKDTATAPALGSQLAPLRLTSTQIAPPSTPARVPSRAFGTDVTQDVINISSPAVSATSPDKPATSSGKRALKTSSVSREAVDKARLYIEKVPQKRTLLDTILEMQEKNNKMWSKEAKEKLLIQKRGHLLEEFKLGILDKEQYLEKVQELEGGGPPAKRRAVSPDWDDTDFYA